ncbi:MAG TPA: hypothetical protein VF457_06620, partial [Burkholderiaceae bacterium]
PSIDDLANFTGEQVGELVHFVEQVSPQALHDVAATVADHPFGLSTYAAAAAALLAGAMRPRRSTIRVRRLAEARPPADDGGH